MKTKNGNDAKQGETAALPRRGFLTLAGLTFAASALDALPVMAGPFVESDFEKLIPADKKLRPEWLKSLFARGEPTVYIRERGELRHIGMPIGGICCGTLYLGGDGKLWLWDIFNENKNGIQSRNVKWEGFGGEQTVDTQNGANYVVPAEPRSPLEQGFALKINGVTRSLDANGWKNIAFTGQYPIGTVTYKDPDCPVFVVLNAYSPFIPLNADDSGLPATICEFTLKNTSNEPVDAELAGWLENASSLFSAQAGSGSRRNIVQKSPAATVVFAQFDAAPAANPAEARPDILLDDFENETYGKWKVEGTAFGTGPVKRTEIPAYQGDVGGTGQYIVNTHSSAPGANVEEKDRHIGKLTSPEFRIERNFLTFFIGGGSNVEEVGLRLLVEGKVVRSAAGRNENKMRRAAFKIAEFSGKMATVEIYDNGQGGWGNVGVDAIIQTDTPLTEVPQDKEHDFGTLALAMLGSGTGKANVTPETIFDALTSDDALQTCRREIDWSRHADRSAQAGAGADRDVRDCLALPEQR